MEMEQLLQWQNLIFLLPMALALLLLAISIIGSGDHHAEADHDVDTDISAVAKVLSVFGVGRVPISILAFCWLMIFGFSGFVLRNFLLENILPSGIILIVSFAGALFCSIFISSLLARVIGKLMPQLESYGERTQDFINREAEVRYTINAHSGTVTLRDKYGNLQQVQVHLDAAWTEPIPPGTKVILMTYNAAGNFFTAVPAYYLTSTNN